MGNTAGSQGQNHVTVFGHGDSFTRGVIERRHIARGWIAERALAAESLDCFSHAFAGDAGNRGLTGSVDVENKDAVGIRKSRRKVIHKVARTRVTMRLEDHMDALEPALPR